jgi:dienelactone hydrolase
MPRDRNIIGSVELQSVGDENIPATLQLPRADGPVPAVLLLHGFSSHKEQMANSIGRALYQRGVGSLAIDLPMHGSRGRVLGTAALKNPLALVQSWRTAQRDARTAIQYLVAHSDVDPRRIGIGGYSLGAYLGLVVAAEDRAVRAVALAAGGDLPSATPFVSLVRSVADPIRAARAYTGRPLFMINGRSDRTVRPDQATALFGAAGEPKELQWYDGGHWPPQSAVDAVADWLAAQLGANARGISARRA